MLPFAIARQRLKVIAWRRPQVAEIASGVEVAQFPARHLDQIGRKALWAFAIEDRLGGLIAEALDHKRYVSCNDTYVNARVSTNDTASATVASVRQLIIERRRRNGPYACSSALWCPFLRGHETKHWRPRCPYRKSRKPQTPRSKFSSRSARLSVRCKALKAALSIAMASTG